MTGGSMCDSVAVLAIERANHGRNNGPKERKWPIGGSGMAESPEKGYRMWPAAQEHKTAQSNRVRVGLEDRMPS